VLAHLVTQRRIPINPPRTPTEFVTTTEPAEPPSTDQTRTI